VKTPPPSGDLTPTHSLVQTLTWAGQSRAEPGVDESRLGVPRRMREGTVINGRYTIRRAIGHGGMGWVYDVGDALHPDRAVALKIAKGLAENPALLSLFKTEFSTMARFDHPNVARVYDFEELRGSADFAITMEQIDGAPINEALQTRDWRVVIDHIVPVCRALSYVHSRRVVHFDLKPANILVDHSAHVKVVDFGIAGGPLGRRRGVVGTPLYMAPELLVGEGGDYRADLYALGVTLYRLLFGETPCPERELSAIARWLSHNHVRVASAARVPAWLGTLVEKLCAPDPADRPRNPSAVIEAINTGGGSTYEFETSETRQSYVTTPRFAGRTRELDTILRFVSQRSSRGGGSPALMVTGVSGIGKSRLMKEVRQAAQLQRLPFIEANCYETNPVEFGRLATCFISSFHWSSRSATWIFCGMGYPHWSRWRRGSHMDGPSRACLKRRMPRVSVCSSCKRRHGFCSAPHDGRRSRSISTICIGRRAAWRTCSRTSRSALPTRRPSVSAFRLRSLAATGATSCPGGRSRKR
jgi:serine/threonine protein kinase